MTSDHQKGRIVIACDSCNAVEEGEAHLGTGRAAFDELWADLKQKGWRAFKTVKGNEWEHRCPDCK